MKEKEEHLITFLKSDFQSLFKISCTKNGFKSFSYITMGYLVLASLFKIWRPNSSFPGTVAC